MAEQEHTTVTLTDKQRSAFAEAAADRASVGIDAGGKYSGGGPS